MRYPILFSIFVLSFSSCADHSKTELAVYAASDEGLNRSTEIITSSTHTLYGSFENKMADYYHNKAVEYWQPKALQVKAYCEDMYQYIDGLKTELKNKSGLHIASNWMESYDEDNVDAVSELFAIKGQELFQKLIVFRKNILAVDTEINLAFDHPLLLFAGGFDYTKNDYKEFTKTFFKNTPAVAAMAMLSRLQNNIRINENNLVAFCHNKASPVILDCSFPQPLVTQSSKYVKAGEVIEVTAGIGIYSTVMERKVTIDGRKMVLNYDQPTAICKVKASGKQGKYSLPVLIEFVNPDGTIMSVKKNIEYYVIEPSQDSQ